MDDEDAMVIVVENQEREHDDTVRQSERNES